MNVFISYSDKDLKIAEKLASLLSGDRMNVWLAHREVLLGDNWALESGKALQRSDALVVLLSPDAVASENVRREIAYALGSPRFEDKVVPVVVRPTKDIPWYLQTMNVIHSRGTHSQSLKRTAEEIIDSLLDHSKRRKNGRLIVHEGVVHR